MERVTTAQQPLSDGHIVCGVGSPCRQIWLLQDIAACFQNRNQNQFYWPSILTYGSNMPSVGVTVALYTFNK